MATLVEQRKPADHVSRYVSRFEAERARVASQPAWLTAKGAARHLDISPSYAGLLLKRGIIPGTQAVPGSMWWVDPAVLDSPQLRETLRALSERRQVQRPHDDRTPQIPGLSEV
jgi:hypothetical protein